MAGNRDIEYILSLRDEASKTLNGFIGSATSGFNTFKNVAISAFSVSALMSFIDASNEAEKLQARLGQALRNAGVEGEATRISMANYAKELAKITVYDDDLISGLQATLVAMTGITGTALNPLTKATLDLATGLQMDAESAAMLVGKTVAGSDALGRYGISTKGATTEGERLAIVLDQINSKYGDFATNEGKTAAGQMQILKNETENLKELLGDTAKELFTELTPALKVVTDIIGRGLLVAINSLKGAFATLFASILSPLAWIEKGMGALGLTTSTVMQDAVEKGMELSETYGTAALNAFKGVNKEAEEAGKVVNKFGSEGTKEVEAQAGSVKQLEENYKALSTELNTLTVGSTAYQAKLAETAAAQKELNNARQEQEGAMALMNSGLTLQIPLLDKMAKGWDSAGMRALMYSRIVIKQVKEDIPASFEETLANIREDLNIQYDMATSAMNTYTGALKLGLSAAFSGSEGAMKKFLLALTNGVIDAVEAMVLAYEAAAIAKSTLSFGATLLADIPKITAAFAVLETARAIIGSFHEGGTVPGGSGATYYDAPPSKEFPVLMRGGETVRTERQEADLQKALGGGGPAMTFNFYGPVSSPDWIIEGIKAKARETGLAAMDLLKDNRSTLAFK